MVRDEASHDPPENAYRACADAVRRVDAERYAASLLAPPASREPLLAVYAFAHEIAKIASIVSEPMLGEIRLQWWRETIDGVFAGTPRRHETAQALAAAVSEHDLPRAPFDALIDAHAFDFYQSPMPSLPALEAYCDAVYGGPMRLGCIVLGAADGMKGRAENDLARAAALGYGLARTISGQSAQARRRQMFAPIDRLTADSVDPEAVFAGHAGEAFIGVILDLGARALQHHRRARTLMRAVSGDLLPAVAPAALTPAYVARAKALGPRLLTEPVQLSPLAMRARLYAAALRGGI